MKNTLTARDVARFVAKVKRTDDCHEWQAATTSDGYGVMRLDGKLVGAHRLAYVIAHGEIPDDLQVRHTCDNRRCVRESHLVSGTHRDNMQDMRERGRACRVQPWNKGEGNGRAKLTVKQVRQLKRLSLKGWTKRSLADRFGIHWMSVHLIVIGRNWKEVTA